MKVSKIKWMKKWSWEVKEQSKEKPVNSRWREKRENYLEN